MVFQAFDISRIPAGARQKILIERERRGLMKKLLTGERRVKR